MANKKLSEQKNSATEPVFRGQNNAKKMRPISILDQWVEVWVDENGVTQTELFPPNEVLIEEGKKMDPPPELVYRRLNFPSGVPDEYLWTCPPNEQARIYGGGCVQRMTVDTWLETIRREQFLPNRLIGPTGRGNVPRPKERGGCECPVCTANEAMLEELGYAT